MNPTEHRGRPWLYLGVVLVTLAGIYFVISGIKTANSTGILHVISTDSKAGLSISQIDKQAESIGVGSANIRLKPGVYTVAASSNGSQAFKDIEVKAKQRSNLSIDPKDTSALPSVLSIQFDGFESLLNHGITASQVNNLKNDFFIYNQSVKKVSITPGSIVPGPHNPSDAGFTTNFNVQIDLALYKAIISYDDLINVRLILHKASNGAEVFDTNNINTN